MLVLSSRRHPRLHSFPTRRSSDLDLKTSLQVPVILSTSTNYTVNLAKHFDGLHPLRSLLPSFGGTGDRKSTRLNSSHEWISYAVFCLKKKTLLRMQAGVTYCVDRR